MPSIDISTRNFFEATDLMISNGMRAAGYEYINVDGGWWEGADTRHIVRNSSGFPTWNSKKFPGGLPAVIDYFHNKGFKYGHYTDAGKAACNHDSPMSEGFEEQDAALFLEWGIDMLKIDSCGVQEGNETVSSRWSTLLSGARRPVLISNCHNGCGSPHGMNKDYSVGWADWCPGTANIWRTSADIRSTWNSVMFNLHSLSGMGAHGGPGRWNDPDFLEVGLGEFRSVVSAQAHFGLWCITSSPLIASPNLKTVKDEILAVLVDHDAIAINQAYAGNAGDLLEQQGEQSQACMWAMCYNMSVGEVWYKPLPNGEAAIVLLNTNTSGVAIRMNVSFARLSVLGTAPSVCNVFDVWGKNSSMIQDEFIAHTIPPKSSMLLKISNCTTAVGASVV